MQAELAEREPEVSPPPAVTILTTYLSAMLQPFHPRVAPTLTSGSKDQHSGEAVNSAPSLFWLCGLELYNHIAESAHCKICENQKCGRLYVRQRGRAQFGQNRMTATKYCSAECAQRQGMQRAYRARQRAKRAKNETGETTDTS